MAKLVDMRNFVNVTSIEPSVAVNEILKGAIPSDGALCRNVRDCSERLDNAM